MHHFSFLFSLIFLFCSCVSKNQQADNQGFVAESNPSFLNSWNDGEVKSAIVNFVSRTTDSTNSDFIQPTDRIAVFDNDGTLWAEQPSYFQLLFAMDRIKALASEHPEWKKKQPFKAVLEGDEEKMKEFHTKDILTLVMATHANLSQEDFQKQVIEWNKKAKHPTTDKPFSDMVYQPMLELLQYLQLHDFKTYIVSGGGVYFMRALVSDIYNIPKEQIIGSTIQTDFRTENNAFEIIRTAQLDFINDKEGKPLNINKIIGKKPVFCAGNSDGDLAMMQYTSTHTLPYLNLYVHHTDDKREWAYDSLTHIGRLYKGFDYFGRDNWFFVDMKTDWKVVFPD